MTHESHSHPNATPHAHGPGQVRRRTSCLVAVTLLAALGTPVQAESVRLWPTAVVLDDTVRLSDLCDLRHFQPETEKALADLVVIPAPPPGGSRIIHLDMIRDVLREGGANLARVTLRGATRCAISRPELAEPAAAKRVEQTAARIGEKDASTADHETVGNQASPNAASSLRQAVTEHFQAKLAKYGGTVEVLFDRKSEPILDLKGPTYGFRVRQRNGSPIGLLSVEVDVLAKEAIVQTVPLAVQVTLTRPTLVARHAINQGATVRSSDVHLVDMSYSRIDKLGMNTPSRAIGQQAKRFIEAGTPIELPMLESVPLVQRGQLVTLRSIAGGVSVVTTAKATEDGLLGDVITLRSLDDRHVEFDAAVVAPGEVQIGGTVPAALPTVVAMGGETK